MEKFGVDEEPDPKQKKASEHNVCPTCGKPVIRHGKLLFCPVHGSEPFEQL